MESGRLLPLLALAGLFAAALAAPDPAEARLLIERDEALRQIYGASARVETRTAYLTQAQADSVRGEARAPFSARRVTYYRATRGDTLLGNAFVDQSVVRTQSATLLVALDATGAVRAVEILAWNEPDDFLPPARWLDRARGQSVAAAVRPGESMPNLAGATLTARAVTASVRRALALGRMLRAGGH